VLELRKRSSPESPSSFVPAFGRPR